MTNVKSDSILIPVLTEQESQQLSEKWGPEWDEYESEPGICTPLDNFTGKVVDSWHRDEYGVRLIFTDGSNVTVGDAVIAEGKAENVSMASVLGEDWNKGGL